ncbi:MAG: ATP-dependent DNA ligase [Actinomycetota bacterium]
MQFAEVAATSEALSQTRSRLEKTALIAALLRGLHPDEIAPAVGFLIGSIRQGRIGVGWASLMNVAASSMSDDPLTVSFLDQAIDELQALTGSGSVAQRNALLTSLFARATTSEQSMLRKLFTGEMRQGALDGVMIDAIAQAASVSAALVRRATMLSGDVRLTARAALTGGSHALESIGLSLFQPVLPMLASSADTVAEALTRTGRASVEWKLDGIRVQAHRAGDDVRVFTRNLNDVTERLPDVVKVVRSLPCDRVLLDGEAIALDEDQRPHLFQDTMSEIGRKLGPQQLQASVFLFDSLHLDGKDLIDQPLIERIDSLTRVAGANRIPSAITDRAEEADEVLRQSLESGHEGVVIKSTTSAYEAGRRGKAWVKVKPVRTLDLVVLAAEWGHGRRKGYLSNLHLGARDPSGGFVMIGKTFKGLTDAVLAWQTEMLLSLEDHREGIAVFVRPELVVEIELDGVQNSTRYPGGVAMRFARVLRYRPDKSSQQADTIETVRSLLPR